MSDNLTKLNTMVQDLLGRGLQLASFYEMKKIYVPEVDFMDLVSACIIED